MSASRPRALAQLQQQRRADLQANRERYQAQRSDLVFTQAGDDAKLRAEWKTRTAARESAWEAHRASPEPAQDHPAQQSADSAQKRSYGDTAADRRAAREAQIERFRTHKAERGESQRESKRDRER